MRLLQNLGYGFLPLGYKAYQNLQYADTVSESELSFDSGIHIEFLDRDGFLLASFYSAAKDFPFASVSFSNSEGGNCLEASLEFLESPEEYEFELDYGYLVKIYLFGSKSPYWFGYIDSVPSEIAESQVYNYKAIGPSKKLEATYFNKSYTSALSLSALVEDVMTNSDNGLINQLKGVSYNASKVDNFGTNIASIKFENQNGLDVLKKLKILSANAAYGFDEEGDFFFQERSTEIDSDFIFTVGINIPSINLEKSSFSSIRNKILVEVKREDSSGSTTLNTLAEQKSSQEIYGIHFEKVSIAEATANLNEEVALDYALALVSQKAFPTYKGQITSYPLRDLPLELQKSQGFARIFGPKRNILQSLSNCEDLTLWLSSDEEQLVLDLESQMVHQGENCVKMSFDASSNAYATLSFSDTEDLNAAQFISFWIRSSLKGDFLSLSLGKDSIADLSDTTFTIDKSGAWQRVKVALDSSIDLDEVNYLSFHFKSPNQSGILYVDDIKIYVYNRKSYDLEKKKITYSLTSDSMVMNIELGSIDFPFSSRLASAISNVEAIKNMISGE